MFLSRLMETIGFILTFIVVSVIVTVAMYVAATVDFIGATIFGLAMIFFALICLAATWKFIYWLFIEPFIRKER